MPPNLGSKGILDVVYCYQMGTQARWHVLPPVSEEDALRLSPILHQGEGPLAAQLLFNRGLRDARTAQAFLSISEDLSHDPFLLADMQTAVKRLHQAVSSEEHLCVFGDFDADGLTGAAILYQALRALGGRVMPHIPHRVTEGYGLNNAALDSLAENGVTLVITTDCGVNAVEEVTYARQLGMDVIVTDHHTISSMAPAAAVINPKRSDSAYPFRDLAGVGVAFKLAQALFLDAGKPLPEDFGDLIALGTIADLVPLLGENRYLVGRGLESLNRSTRPGLVELMRRAGLSPGKIDSRAVSHTLAPRLNASGRIDHSITSFKLLITDSSEEAKALADELEKNNAQRQQLTEEALALAREQAASQEGSPILLAMGPFTPGVTGLIASRLVDEFSRPAIVIALGEKESRGSARSIPEFNVISALIDCKDILSRFGGHPKAAGFTVSNNHIDALHKRLVASAASLPAETLLPTITIDGQIPLSSMGPEAWRTVKQFAPFGMSNPEPVFLSNRVKISESRMVGDNHLLLKIHDGKMTWPAIGFKRGEDAGAIGPWADIVYNLAIDRWGNGELLELRLCDWRPAT